MHTILIGIGLGLALCFFATPARTQEISVSGRSTGPSVWSAPAEGPALTLAGSGAFLVGGLVSAAGAAQRECSDGECGPRFALLLGGAGFSGLLGALGIGIGARIWRGSLGEAPEHLEDSSPRADPSAFGAGIGLVVVGSCSYTVGLIGSTIGAQNSSGATFFLGGPVGATLIGVGSLGIAVGGPMTHLGNRRLPPDQLIQVVPVIGPGHVGISGSF